MADPLVFDASTYVNADNLNKMINRVPVNLVRNGSFESWLNGTVPGVPDGWWLSSYGAVSGRYAVSSTGLASHGDYCCGIALFSSGAADDLRQDLSKIFGDGYRGKTFSASIRMQCPAASDKVRFFLSDGVSKTYADGYANGTAQTFKVTKTFSASASQFWVGVTCLDGTYTVYVDDVVCVPGETVPPFQENPADRSLIVQNWDNNGTVEKTLGGLYLVPFKKTGTISGADPDHSFTYTLPDGAGSSTGIILAQAEVYSLGSSSPEKVIASARAHTQSTVTVYLHNTAGNFTNGEAFEVRGAILCSGWKTYGKVFGD